jgi:hypothetical protein
MIMATIILSIQESASVPSTPIPRRPTAICDGVNASAAEVPFAKVPFRAQMDFNISSVRSRFTVPLRKLGMSGHVHDSSMLDAEASFSKRGIERAEVDSCQV